MKWSLKPTSRKSGWLKKLAEEQGKEFQSLKDEPTLFPDLRWIWDAFVYLDKRRPPSFSTPAAIPPSEILAYCHLMSIYGIDEKEDLTRMVGVLDDTYLDDYAEKKRAEDNKNKSKNRRPPTRF